MLSFMSKYQPFSQQYVNLTLCSLVSIFVELTQALEMHAFELFLRGGIVFDTI